MPVRETSKIALEKIKGKIGADEQVVFELLLELGPTHDRRILEALNQKERKSKKPKSQQRTWEIMSVTGRRNRLLGRGFIRDLGPHKGSWHGKSKKYHIWAVVGDDRDPAGWTPVPRKKPKPRFEFAKVGHRRATAPTGQLLFG